MSGPKCDIQPLSFRGVHYDLARGNFDSFASLRQLARFSAGCGLNTLVLYMEDLWRWRGHPRISSPHAYAIRDVARFAEEIAALGIDFIPSLTTLGHSRHILEKPGYRRLAFPGSGGDFNVFHPGVDRLFGDLLDELLPHFRSPYVFLNGDEMRLSRLDARARCAARKGGLGTLHGHAMGRLARMALARGKRPIVWHDLFFHYPGSLRFLPRETILAYWYYDLDDAFPAVPFLCRKGFDVIACPGVVPSPHWPADLARALPNIEGQTREAARWGDPGDGRPGRCLGTLLTIWEDADWKSSALAIHTAGKLAGNPSLSGRTILRSFGREAFGVCRPGLGRACVEGPRLAELVVARREAGERAASCSRVVVQVESAARVFRGGRPVINRPVFAHLARLAGRMAKRVRRSPSRGPPSAAPASPLLCLSVVDSCALGCRLVEGRTAHGHRFVVLTNGLLAVTVLPEFGGAMIEWVLLGARPLNFLSSSYARWAEGNPPRPSDPGLGCPWATNRIGGWRETIYFNTRLNPSTLWGRPFSVRKVRQTRDLLVVEFRGRNEVADVRRTVTLHSGRATLGVGIVAANRLGPCALALQVNALHAFPGVPASRVEVEQPKGRGSRRHVLPAHDGTKTFLPSSNRLRVRPMGGGPSIGLRWHRGQVRRVLTDATPDLFTLEPFTPARFCERGDEVRLDLEYALRYESNRLLA